MYILIGDLLEKIVCVIKTIGLNMNYIFIHCPNHTDHDLHVIIVVFYVCLSVF